ncbi:CBO0543 family protein [Paenibacillus sp. H1-7]|uniref:CBO0543 family protein n=1 Tax=Paenibacillus sp. H1-7 TaxID=2282849 RepID=UPI001EF7AD00|nr:CBO0543 family protein [Paenibacillus sp. H1-7]
MLLILIIPRQKHRLAMVAFLFKQYITCIFGHAVVEHKLLAYPVRELADVSRTSFTYEYMAYPMTCAVFNAYYPNHRSGWIQFGYYVLFTTVLTIVEVLLVQYTDLIRYIRWNWFWSWVTIFLTFLMTRAFCVIYFGTMTRVETAKQKNASSTTRS